MFFDYNYTKSQKLKTNSKKYLTNTLLASHAWIKEEAMEKIRKHYELNKNKNMMY